MSAYQSLVGMQFDRLTVIERGPDIVQPNGHHKTRYWCECSCDKHTRILVRGDHLKDGHIRSCGCLNSQLASERRMGVPTVTTHGKSGGIIYNSYKRIIERYVRTAEPNAKVICDEWFNPSNVGINNEEFKSFYNWSMINSADDTKTFIRLDQSLPYSPENCAWVDKSAARLSTNVENYVMFNGDRSPVAQVANALGYQNESLLTTVSRHNYDPVVISMKNGVPQLYNYRCSRPINAIYFKDQNGLLVNQNDYKDPQPTPALWATDDKGFITGHML